MPTPYQSTPFGARMISPELILGKRGTIGFVLNLMQSDEGLAVMAIPENPAPLLERSPSERTLFFQEAYQGFSDLWLFDFPFVEVLANQGDQVGQTVPHTHLHCFVGRENFLLNWGKEGFPEGVSKKALKDWSFSVEEQYNIYGNSTDSKPPILYLISHSVYEKEHCPMRKKDISVLDTEEKLFSDWKLTRDQLRARFYAQ